MNTIFQGDVRVNLQDKINNLNKAIQKVDDKIKTNEKAKKVFNPTLQELQSKAGVLDKEISDLKGDIQEWKTKTASAKQPFSFEDTSSVEKNLKSSAKRYKKIALICVAGTIISFAILALAFFCPLLILADVPFVVAMSLSLGGIYGGFASCFGSGFVAVLADGKSDQKEREREEYKQKYEKYIKEPDFQIFVQKYIQNQTNGNTFHLRKKNLSEAINFFTRYKASVDKATKNVRILKTAS